MLATQHKYTALHKPNQLIYGTGTVVVVTGWTPKERVAKLLESHQYAAIGNLYSPAGVDLLVRNLLHNPHITGVLVLWATQQDTNSGALAALRQFVDGGFSVGADIHADDVERIRQLSWNILFDENKLWMNDFIERLTSQKPLGGKPKVYPIPEVKSEVVPSPLYGHRVEGKTVAETWVKILHRIRTGGVLRPTGYDGQWQELIDLMAVVTDEPREFYIPHPNYLPCDRAYLTNYIPSILEDAPYVPGVKYTYGQRLRSHFGRDQVEQVVEKLVGEIDAASAVMNLWDAADHERGGSPCLNQIWVRVVNKELSLTATLRSNDMFNAWPANAFGLRALQMHIRDRIEHETNDILLLGPLVTLSQSAHLYDHSFAYADEVVEKHYGKAKKEYNDPVGNFLVETVGNQIKVSRMDAEGKPVREYLGRSVGNLLDAIALDAPAIQPSHALYLGVQLERAWNSLRYGENFTQD
ncbi:thymidylate synthase [Allocoleopsis sp.]|uniref:thymidylate synthase n=1 Tax=Allocoleopsis sp. TaxID=3088169 RepID=UPI002FCF620D